MLSAVTQNAYEAGDGRLSEPLLSALTRFLELLSKIPRSLRAKSTSTWIIFTDAYSWDSRASCQQLRRKAQLLYGGSYRRKLTMINVSKRKAIIFECVFSQFSAQCGRGEKN
jgi:hypothetical protein